MASRLVLNQEIAGSIPVEGAVTERNMMRGQVVILVQAGLNPVGHPIAVRSGRGLVDPKSPQL